MAREKKQPGVELHGRSFRYRMRVMDAGQKRVAKYKRWPFVEGEEAKKLSPSHPLRRENALTNANAFALQDRHRRKSPRFADGAVEAEGTLLEWLLRYQAEALELRAFQASDIEPMLAGMKIRKGLPRPPTSREKLAFRIQPRASAEHDIGQIRTIVRIAETEGDIADMLHTQVTQLGAVPFQRLLSLWAKGKAKPKTLRRLITTFNGVWKHHRQFYDMRLERPWADIEIPGDGSKPKARAITRDELRKIDSELNRLHPSVRGAISFLRWTGARRAEACKLRWEMLHWNVEPNSSPSAHFERTKAARGAYKARFTYLEQGAIEALAECAAAQRSPPNPVGGKKAFDWRTFDWPKKGWVFPAPESPTRPLAGQTVYQAFTRCVKHAGVAHVSPHHLRHTRATVLTATIPQAMAQELLGHDDAATFAIYRHLGEEAGYLMRDSSGALVSADALKSKEAIKDAIKKLPKKERAALVVDLLAD